MNGTQRIPDLKTALCELIIGTIDRLDRSIPGDMVSGEVRLLTETADGTLSILDDGAGLSPADVEEGLSKASLGTEGFWAGLLACQPFCSRLEVLTQAPENGAHGSRVLFTNGEAQISHAEVESPGTAVHLQILPKHFRLLNDDLLTQLVRKHCDFVRFPIYLGRGWAPINHPNPTWYRESPEPELQRALQTSFQIGTLLATFPLPTEGSGPRVRGALYVRPRRHRAMLRLYCRGVFVDATEASLLGAGLRELVSGVIDADVPARSACRELLEPAAFQGAWFRQMLIQNAANGILTLARQRRKHFQKLIEEHGSSLKAACLALPEELGELRHHLSYSTSLRESATLVEILGGRRDRVVIYADDLGVAASLLPLYKRSNTEVVYMMDPLDEKLRQEWRIDGERIEFQRVDFDPPRLTDPPTNGEPPLLGDLAQLFHSSIDPALDVEIASLGLEGPPSVLSISEHDRRKLEMLLAIFSRQEQARVDELPPDLAHLVKTGMLDITSITRKLILNCSHRIFGKLIAGLASDGTGWPDGGLEPLLARCLYGHALLSSGLHLPRSKIAELTRTLTELIINLMPQTDEGSGA